MSSPRHTESLALPKVSRWQTWRVRQRIQSAGHDLQVVGRPTILNQGHLELGDNCVLRADISQLRLAISPGASLYIGNRTHLNGVIIAATTEVRIGDDCWLAPYVHLMDSDFHDIEDRTKPGKQGPIHIGNRVKIGARVIILRGVAIGDDVVIAPGSVVVKDIPAGSYASGTPAKVRV